MALLNSSRCFHCMCTPGEVCIASQCCSCGYRCLRGPSPQRKTWLRKSADFRVPVCSACVGRRETGRLRQGSEKRQRYPETVVSEGHYSSMDANAPVDGRDVQLIGGRGSEAAAHTQPEREQGVVRRVQICVSLIFAPAVILRVNHPRYE